MLPTTMPNRQLYTTPCRHLAVYGLPIIHPSGNQPAYAVIIFKKYMGILSVNEIETRCLLPFEWKGPVQSQQSPNYDAGLPGGGLSTILIGAKGCNRGRD